MRMRMRMRRRRISELFITKTVLTLSIKDKLYRIIITSSFLRNKRSHFIRKFKGAEGNYKTAHNTNYNDSYHGCHFRFHN